MKFLYFPVKTNFCDTQLRKLCSNSQSFIDLIHAWCSVPGQALCIRKNIEPRFPQILTEFQKDQAILAVCCVPVEQAKWSFPALGILNEATNQSTNENAALYTLPWFRKRNRRLRIRFSRTLGHMQAPPEALSELILSYVLSSNGAIRIFPLSCRMSRHTSEFIVVSLTLLNQRNEQRWEEWVVMSSRRFNQFMIKRRNSHPERVPSKNKATASFFGPSSTR